MSILRIENMSIKNNEIKTKQKNHIMNCNNMYKYPNTSINNTRNKMTQQIYIKKLKLGYEIQTQIMLFNLRK